MSKKTKYEEAFWALDWREREPWLQKALAKYDNVMFCPGCKGLLSGLHERTSHFRSIVAKEAAKMWSTANV